MHYQSMVAYLAPICCTSKFVAYIWDALVSVMILKVVVSDGDYEVNCRPIDINGIYLARLPAVDSFRVACTYS